MGSTYQHKPRVATFEVTKVKNVRVFKPVNKRAQKVARKVGKRTRLSVADLRQFKGYHKLMQRVNGKLVTIKL